MHTKTLFSMQIEMDEPAEIFPLQKLSPERFETSAILKKLASAGRKLAELKGVVESIPNRGILINTLAMQEAKDSSEIENIVTTHDELFQGDLSPGSALGPAAKEVLRYRQALQVGFKGVQSDGLLTTRRILEIQATLEQNNAGFRKVPGTVLKDGAGETVYTPPQNPDAIVAAMGDLEHFINDAHLFDADPLIKMALIHHQFESIHPFYDGNGRTGRIINVLYLVQQGLLDIPVLYLSRHLVRTKSDYYRLLQSVRTEDTWEEWILYILTAVEETSVEAIITIQAVKKALMETKRSIRASYKFYSQDLINNLFDHPYTKVEFIERDLKVSRLTATKYLEALVSGGFLQKQKIGRTNYYMNPALTAILTGESMQSPNH
ncbi:MAG: Fic family protein [Luteolibacter sp.]|uniref:Fic family protein n=1 Tax=Luteolibacter sp. TaxID=1962973 RepID=UPI003263970A